MITRQGYENLVCWKEGEMEREATYFTFEPMTRGEAMDHLIDDENMDNVNMRSIVVTSEPVVLGISEADFLEHCQKSKRNVRDGARLRGEG